MMIIAVCLSLGFYKINIQNWKYIIYTKSYPNYIYTILLPVMVMYTYDL